MTTFVFIFKKKLCAAVKSGAKRQAVIAPRKDGLVPKPGDIAALYAGACTRADRYLGRGTIEDVVTVQISFEDYKVKSFVIGERAIGFAEATRFALDEGFHPANPLSEMLIHFRLEHGERFHGHCVRWTLEG